MLNDMNRKMTTLLLSTLAIIVIAGGVWYARKSAPEAPPVVSDNKDQVVDKTDNGLSGGEIDTSGWRVIKGVRDVHYTVRIPNDFKLFNPYTETYTEAEPTNNTIVADEFFLKSGDSVIAAAKEAKALFNNKEKTLVEILKERAESDENTEIVFIGNTEFSKTKNGKYDYSFTTTDNAFALTFVFDNVNDQIIQKILESFEWNNKN